MRIDSAIITGSFSVNGDTFNDLGSYSTTGSNAFTGSQNITGSLVVSGSFNLTESASAFQIQGNGFGQTYLQSPNGAIVLNPGYGGVEITGVNNRFSTTDAYITNLYASNGVVSGSSQIVDILSPLNSYTQSNDTTNTTQNSRLTSLESITGSLATTGSNTFYGQQVFSGSLYVQDNLIVQGSSSLQNITASAVSIGTNIVYLNTDTPAVRFAGLTVQDSGSSAGVTGSMLWDSLCNRWIYSNPSTIGYSGGMLLSGPRTQTLGTESPLTCNYVAKSGGGDHLYDSCIIDDGTTVCVNANLKGSGTINGTTIYGSTNVCSPIGLFSGCVGVGITPIDKLHVNGNIISEGCFFSGAPDNLRIFAGHWSTTSGNSNCYLVFQGGGGSTSFGTPSGWGGSASIYTVGQNRLSINCTGVACFSNTICAASTYLGGCASVGGTTYDFGFEVFSSKNTAITSNNTFGANLNFIFNRDNTDGTRNCFNILTDQNAAYLRTLGSFPLILSTNSSDRLTISNTGIASFSCRVGIGFTNPTAFLHVCGNNCGTDISCGGGNADSRGIIHAQLSNVATNRNASVTVETPYGIGQFMEWDVYGMRIGHRVIKGTTCGNVYLTTGQDNIALTLYCGGEAGFSNTVCFSGHVIPTSNNSYCLGNSTYAWAHIYTNDLHLSNEGKCGGNDVDGTNGNWTIQEGAENLYIINNSNCKRFKIKLEEII
jgi:hypothetical protein